MIKGISDLSVLTRAIFYSRNITACLPNFALRLFEFATSESSHIKRSSIL